jgi:hypothetical protein
LRPIGGLRARATIAVTRPRSKVTGIRENLCPTTAAVATLPTCFTPALRGVLEGPRGRRR